MYIFVVPCMFNKFFIWYAGWDSTTFTMVKLKWLVKTKTTTQTPFRKSIGYLFGKMLISNKQKLIYKWSPCRTVDLLTLLVVRLE